MSGELPKERIVLNPRNGACTVFDLFIEIFARVMSWMFVIGVSGCLFVIPITAYRLFSVLFEKDRPDEE